MNSKSLSRLVGAVASVLGFAAAAAAQFGERVGPEFQVNSSFGGDRSNARVGMAAAGRFFVVWNGAGSDGNLGGIVGRRFDSAGAPEGNEFRVNTTVVDDQSLPDVAMNAVGIAVVVWQSLGQDGSGWGVYAQRYDTVGAAAGPEFRVNTTALGDQASPSVALDGVGRFVVCWRGATNTGTRGVFGQRFDATGTPLGGEFMVGDAGTSDTTTAVAMNAAGRFVVGWADSTARARSFDEAGSPLGPAIGVFPLAYPPRVGIDDAGRFVLVFGDSLGGPSIATFHEASGSLRRFVVLPVEFYWNPGIATNGAGASLLTGGTIGRIYAQTFNAAGDPLTWPLLANPATPNNAYPAYPSLAIGAAGQSVVVWQTSLTGVADILAQRYGQVAPSPMNFHTLSPCRLVDTRVYPDSYGGTLGANARLFQIAGKCGLPATAQAIAANFVAAGPTAAGHLSFLPSSAAGGLAEASALNFGPGETRSNNAVLPVGTGGELRVRSVQLNGFTNFILDVVGYFE